LRKGFLQVLGVFGKLLDAVRNAGAVIVFGDCSFRAA
jgi:formylmethanofuran dehydrogenase subunit C